MAPEIKTLDTRNRQEWRTWLGKHHASSPGVWLVFYKVRTGMESISYEDSVQDALCFGWIDSLVKRIDEDRYARKFTPRIASAGWNSKRLIFSPREAWQ
jgi:uncharacterized protein YdeI (YjbR/CyaY-like superfamily)